MLLTVEIAVVAIVAALGATAVRGTRRRRARDLAVLAAVGTALGRSRARAGHTRPWSEALTVLRAHLQAERVTVTGPATGTTDHFTDHVPAGRTGGVWTRRRASDAVREVLDERGVDEVVVVPLRGAAGTLGALEVHGPTRPWWARHGGVGRLVPRRAYLLAELTLLATVASQVAAVIDAVGLEDRLRHDARHDALTGLRNRAGFLEAAAHSLRGARPGGVAVIAFSLLDQVTDTLGHARGERFVGLAAERLAAVCGQRWFPGDAVAARLEGDTFAVVVAEPDPDAAHRLAVRMREQLAAPYEVEGLPFEAPVHVGVALEVGGTPEPIPSSPGEVPDGTHVAALLRRADVALAAARRGGPPVRCYEPGMGERAARRLALIRGFAGAAATGQLRVHYQPTVALRGPAAAAGGAVLGVEALARWRHPELGELLPDEFVPVLEATGQITELTRFVLDEALGAARGWLDAGLRLTVAVNVPVGNLADPEFPGEVAARLARHRVPAELLTLELTESGVSAEREAALPVLGRLHALGCRLAVDDFGTGQSSLAHLRRLPVDQVKIDKSFVLGMDTELGDVAVVRAIVEMGHTLGLTVVAEGVEQAAVRTALVEMGCDIAQGYLVSRPLPAGSLEQWLASLAALPAVPGGEGGPLTLIA